MMSFREFRQNVPYEILGVAPPDCFKSLPPAEHPMSIFPDGKSVVVLGREILRGSFRAMEEGSLWQTPGRWLPGFDDVIRLIEKYGFECVPYLPEDAPRMPGRPVRAGSFKPNTVTLSIEYAAVCAGLGELGYHGMFMTHNFGIRQQLGLLVTDMEIEPGPPEPSPAVCDGCMECASDCPLQAISKTETVNLDWNGNNMRTGAIAAAACRECPNGACGDSKFFAGSEELNFDLKNNRLKGEYTSSFALGGLPNRLSAACGRSCIARFEETHNAGRAKARGRGERIPFRIRKPWGFRPDARKEN